MIPKTIADYLARSWTQSETLRHSCCPSIQKLIAGQLLKSFRLALNPSAVSTAKAPSRPSMGIGLAVFGNFFGAGSLEAAAAVGAGGGGGTAFASSTRSVPTCWAAGISGAAAGAGLRVTLLSVLTC